LNGYPTPNIDTVSFDIKFNCDISEEGEVNSFVDCYMKETNETIKLKYKKKDRQRSIYTVKAIYSEVFIA